MLRGNQSENPDIHNSTYVVVWAGLLALLLLNIAAARLLTGWMGIMANISIASIQALLVLSFLMHLRYEKGMLRLIVPLVVIIIFILLGLVFSDVAYR